MASTPPLGGPAPDIDLAGWAHDATSRFRLSDQRGHAVVLAFYPGDDTPVCTRQMCSYSDGLDLLTGLGAVVWGISAQDLDSHERFATRRGITFPLLADTGKIASTAYGVGGRLLAKRAVFVVDAQGILRWSHVSTLGLTYQDSDTLAEVRRGLQGAPA